VQVTSFCQRRGPARYLCVCLVLFALIWFCLVWFNLVGFVWFGLVWVGLGWVGLGWDALGWDALGWVGLGWVGLGWVGLGWVGLDWFGFVRVVLVFHREEIPLYCVYSLNPRGNEKSYGVYHVFRQNPVSVSFTTWI
jgi:hypothetical protein